MMHYHGTPISPRRVLLELAGKNFCVSFAHPNDVGACHQIGQSVMLDNGAFSLHTRGKSTDWDQFYAWAEPWLDYQTTWMVIPDVIGGDEAANDELLRQCAVNKTQASPVWHLHEPIDRIFRLLDMGYHRISFGSSGEYWHVGGEAWCHRMCKTFNRIASAGPIPWIHMLRGMQFSGQQFPFSSVDSTDVARNHNRRNNAREMADRWDALQSPATWSATPEQEVLL